METLLTVAGLAGALMGFAHYALPRLLGTDDPHPLWRFVVGVGLGILTPLWGLATLRGDGCLTMGDALVVCIGAGAGTVLAYLVDLVGGRREATDG